MRLLKYIKYEDGFKNYKKINKMRLKITLYAIIYIEVGKNG